MQTIKEIENLLASSAAIGYTTAILEAVNLIENTRKEWDNPVADAYVYNLLNRLQKLKGRSFEVGRNVCNLEMKEKQ